MDDQKLTCAQNYGPPFSGWFMIFHIESILYNLHLDGTQTNLETFLGETLHRESIGSLLMQIVGKFIKKPFQKFSFEIFIFILQTMSLPTTPIPKKLMHLRTVYPNTTVGQFFQVGIRKVSSSSIQHKGSFKKTERLFYFIVSLI